MSETWFQTARYGIRIKPIQVERSTADSVWVDGRRKSRSPGTYGTGIYPTWEEAKGALLTEAEYKVAQARNALHRANDELGNVKGLKP